MLKRPCIILYYSTEAVHIKGTARTVSALQCMWLDTVSCGLGTLSDHSALYIPLIFDHTVPWSRFQQRQTNSVHCKRSLH